MEKGLIKGGSIENAVVIRDEEILSKEPLRFEEEFARHKILDVIGDLMLSGKRIMGHIICVKPGHGPNTQVAALLQRLHYRVQLQLPATLALQLLQRAQQLQASHQLPLHARLRILNLLAEAFAALGEHEHCARACVWVCACACW